MQQCLRQLLGFCRYGVSDIDHADELVRLLEEATPDRAWFYYLLYAGGFRIGELKRHGRKHLRPDYSTHGAVNILRTQHLPGQGEHRSSKGKQSRTVEFLSKYPT